MPRTVRVLICGMPAAWIHYPIFLQEMVTAVWLVIKGFRAPGPAEPGRGRFPRAPNRGYNP